MRKQAPPLRTDEQLIAAITARLDYKPSTRTAIENSVCIGKENALRLLAMMQADNTIEAYRGKNGRNVCDLYCLFGKRPASVVPSAWHNPTQTLNGFRNAVLAAYAAGNDPFMAAA